MIQIYLLRVFDKDLLLVTLTVVVGLRLGVTERVERIVISVLEGHIVGVLEVVIVLDTVIVLETVIVRVPDAHDVFVGSKEGATVTTVEGLFVAKRDGAIVARFEGLLVRLLVLEVVIVLETVIVLDTVIVRVPDTHDVFVAKREGAGLARFEGLFVKLRDFVLVREFVRDPLRERVVVIVRVGDLLLERVTVIEVEIVLVGLIVGRTVIRLRDGVTVTVTDLLTHVVGVIERVALEHLVSVGKEEGEIVEHVEGLRVILTE